MPSNYYGPHTVRTQFPNQQKTADKIIDLRFSGRVRKIAKGDYLLRHVRLSVSQPVRPH